MLRGFLVVFAFLLSPLSLFAQQVDIKMEHRRNNDTGIQCVWSTLETLAKHHGIDGAMDIATNNRSFSGPGPAARELRRRNVQFEQIVDRSDKGFKFLRTSLESGVGCLIGVGMGKHAVTCVGVDDQFVYYIDNVGPKHIRKYTHVQFRETWDGWVLKLVPTKTYYRFRGTLPCSLL